MDIEKLLPEGSKKLIHELDETINYCCALDMEQSYKKRFL
jgi:hypothetical protein